MTSRTARVLTSAASSIGLTWAVLHFVLVRLRHNSHASTANPEVLFFNRVPKTGSENLVHVMLHLAKINGFTHKRAHHPVPRRLTEKEQVRRTASCSYILVIV